ncbi:MAG: hypothetical protein R8F63_10355 [Acidimicrobiales bacterium]|nr:hypothetical protein [Acidimicrobiales bacterium]
MIRLVTYGRDYFWAAAPFVCVSLGALVFASENRIVGVDVPDWTRLVVSAVGLLIGIWVVAHIAISRWSYVSIRAGILSVMLPFGWKAVGPPEVCTVRVHRTGRSHCLTASSSTTSATRTIPEDAISTQAIEQMRQHRITVVVDTDETDSIE